MHVCFIVLPLYEPTEGAGRRWHGSISLFYDVYIVALPAETFDCGSHNNRRLLNDVLWVNIGAPSLLKRLFTRLQSFAFMCRIASDID